MTAEQLSNLSQQPLILVIDDDPIMRRLIRLAMEQETYGVIEASNGKEGLDVYLQRMPDIILLDLMMPVMNGLEFCQQLQVLFAERLSQRPSRGQGQEEKLDGDHGLMMQPSMSIPLLVDEQRDFSFSTMIHSPILMITALEDSDSVNRAFDLGVTDFITKPIHWAILKQRVKLLINQTKLYQRLEAVNEQLQCLAAVDPLTQLANRRVFDLVLERQWRLMVRHKTPLSLIFVDIDYFKNYNDFYGHQAGDHCLFEVARAIASQIKRPTDLVARYGGEEMIVVLPETAYRGAKLIANRIQDAVRGLQIPHLNSAAKPFVTVSLGVAVMEQPATGLNCADLLTIADRALYEAKAQGRNCIVSKLVTPEQ